MAQSNQIVSANVYHGFLSFIALNKLLIFNIYNLFTHCSHSFTEILRVYFLNESIVRLFSLFLVDFFYLPFLRMYAKKKNTFVFLILNEREFLRNGKFLINEKNSFDWMYFIYIWIGSVRCHNICSIYPHVNFSENYLFTLALLLIYEELLILLHLLLNRKASKLNQRW